MGLIIKTPAETGEYQRLLLDQSFININGVYVATLVYKNKDERIKEKAREVALKEFLINSQNKQRELSNLIQIVGEVRLTDTQKAEITNFAPVSYLLNQLEKVIYKYQSEQNRRSIPEAVLQEAEKYGFSREWATDPVILIRKDVIRLDDYKKQDFTLDVFYTTIKENIYTDNKGNLLVEDDL